MRTFPFTASTAKGLHAAITFSLYSGDVRLTTANEDVTLGGDLFKAAGAVNLTQILFTSDGTPLGADIRISPENNATVSPDIPQILRGWGARGQLDGIPIKIELYDISDPGAGSYDLIPGAFVGSVNEDTNGVIILAVTGPLGLLRGNVTEVFTLTCKAKFGDDRCKKPLDVPLVKRNTAYITQADAASWVYTRQVWARVFQSGSYHDLVYECTTAGTTHATTQPTYPTSAGGTVTDGTAVFTARAADLASGALLVAATGVALDFFNIQLTATPDPEPTVTGNIIPQTGPLAGFKMPISAFDFGTNIVTLFEPVAPTNLPSGTQFLIHPGCDKRMTTCRDTYDNLKNIRATPYAPAADLITGRA
jgi:hypothetical protein